MAKQPPSTSTTKLNNDSATDVKLKTSRTVTYVFSIKSSKNLNLPYAVSVNGRSRNEFSLKPKTVNGNGGKIIVDDLKPGERVALFLNSDAHPKYRSHPVYSVNLGNNDIIVYITEKNGKFSSEATPVAVDKRGNEVAEKVDLFDAVLTGDIWMRVSDKYVPAEVEDYLPKDIHPAIAAAVRKIYAGLTQPSLDLVINSTAVSKQPRCIRITFSDSSNALNNINSGYDLLSEGLTRVHPAGFIAVFAAAFEAGVDKIGMTSTWRPMEGSIAHRAGLGLDINYVGSSRINRQELRESDAVDTDNVSPHERQLFKLFEQAKERETEAKKAVKSALAQEKLAMHDAAKLKSSRQNLKTLKDAASAAENQRKDAESRWSAERDKNEPDEVKRFRTALIKCKSVAQVFDPWVMDSNTHDAIAAVSNMQINKNEILHSHHLHITVYEPKIL